MAEYEAVLFRQTRGSADVVLFAAKATDIEAWAGVPQRELLDGRETVGFQREENPNRLAQLSRFYADSSNVVQNPLLCAMRDTQLVTFTPLHADGQTEVQLGKVTIADPAHQHLNIRELFQLLRLSLEARSPQLVSVSPLQDRVAALGERLGEDGHDLSEMLGELETSEDDGEESSDTSEGVAGLFATETHILEFYQEVVCRLALLEKMSDEALLKFADGFLGFTREVLEGYLKPVFLVDGQHRLKGALRAAETAAAESIRTGAVAVGEAEDAEEAARRLTEHQARRLPVSLLMSASPEEHVFQFVVVNQKATPVGKALLGTIVATSLAEDELNGVTDRLEQVGINVADSQAVAWFTRNPESPFCGLVQQGIGGEGGDKLPWSVLRDLLSQFRGLTGARLYNSPKIDYAALWARKNLGNSPLVEPASSLQDQIEAWGTLDGPWRDVAAAFFAAVRDKLGNTSNPAAENYWGSTKSNLYNKISLSILLADFLQWMSDRSLTMESADAMDALVDTWLEDVSPNYFARPWELSGVKKDTPGIRAQWAELWVNYRKDPSQLPDRRLYRKSKNIGA